MACGITVPVHVNRGVLFKEIGLRYMREMGSGSKHGNWPLDHVPFVSWQQGRQGKVIQAKGVTLTWVKVWRQGTAWWLREILHSLRGWRSVLGVTHVEARGADSHQIWSLYFPCWQREPWRDVMQEDHCFGGWVKRELGGECSLGIIMQSVVWGGSIRTWELTRNANYGAPLQPTGPQSPKVRPSSFNKPSRWL